MVFNATFNNISAITWRSVLMMEETGVPRENNDLPQVTDQLYHIILYRVYLTMKAFQGIQINNFSGDMLSYYICRGRSNQHMITDATAS